MRTVPAVLAVLTVLGTTVTVASATAPGKNGRLVFRRYLDPGRTTGALFTANTDGSKVRRVTRPRRGVIDQEADWSPNGRMIAFERRLPCPAAGPKHGLDNACTLVYTVKGDGNGLEPLVACDFAESCHGVHTPAWSPDGSKIAFRLSLSDSRYVDSLNLNAGIWIANADGSDRRQITQVTPGNSWDSGPQWSPDGTKLVFVRADLDRKADAVFTVNIDGTALFQVTPWNLNGGDDGLVAGREVAPLPGRAQGRLLERLQEPARRQRPHEPDEAAAQRLPLPLVLVLARRANDHDGADSWPGTRGSRGRLRHDSERIEGPARHEDEALGERGRLGATPLIDGGNDVM